MRTDVIAVLRDAWGTFVRDRDPLLGIAGFFLFLPAFGLTLLVPAPPAPGSGGNGAAAQAWIEAVGAWGGAHGGWFILAYVVDAVGSAAILSLYLDPAGPDVRGALVRAATLAPRFVLAMIAIALPAGLGLLLWLIPGLFVLGRTMLVAPVLIAERPVGALAAIGRAWRMGRGSSLALMALAGSTYVTGWIASTPFLALDAGLRAGGGSRVAIALADAGAAAVAAAAGLAGTLVARATYRRLAAR